MDAIVPVWAYMLIASKLEPYAKTIVHGDLGALENALFSQSLTRLISSDYQDKKVVIKGCGDKPVPVSAYTEITRRLRPFVSSIAYGEPCSTVPVYKRSKI